MFRLMVAFTLGLLVPVAVQAAQRSPRMSGLPPTTVLVDELYDFVPTASDPDGDALMFTIANQPRWATFNKYNGRLLGTPRAGEDGSYTDIRISVTDGNSTVPLLAFTVNVRPNPDGSAPRISGSPQTAVRVDELYDFTPTASDADGDALTFTIDNQPRWATFNKYNGRLLGTPRSGEEGSYSDIQIAVTDGRSTVAMQQFTVAIEAIANGSATLSWLPPTQNTDGSPLTDLAGYWIYLGHGPGLLARTHFLNQPGLTRFVVENLSPKVWHFAMTAVDSSGSESGLSATVSKAVY
jgi:hypothetical protein